VGKTVAIVQSNYIPWKGYFDLINFADALVLYDDVQYTRQDWRNRNRVKTSNGPLWLTIPVIGRYPQTIEETLVSDPGWGVKHWKTIAAHYARAPYFKQYRELLEELYRTTSSPYLSQINRRFLDAFCELLRIETRLTWSSDYGASGARTERLVQICRQAGATEYLSGPAARSYLDESLFDQQGIAVRYMDYSGYPEYPQLHPPFDHAVSIVDLLLNVGPEAPRYMKSFGARELAAHVARQ
jgi:hypothetical protein